MVNKYTAHAAARMRLRGITKADVDRVLETGDIRLDRTATKDEPKYLAVGTYRKTRREIGVIFITERLVRKIITVMFIDP
jgi:hypothetical protein